MIGMWLMIHMMSIHLDMIDMYLCRCTFLLGIVLNIRCCIKFLSNNSDMYLLCLYKFYKVMYRQYMFDSNTPHKVHFHSPRDTS